MIGYSSWAERSLEQNMQVAGYRQVYGNTSTCRSSCRVDKQSCCTRTVNTLFLILTHLCGAGVYVRQVDAAGSEVDEGHRDALSLQSGELVEVHRAELDVVDEVVWVGSAEAEGEVILVEQSELLLQGVQEGGSGVGVRCQCLQSNLVLVSMTLIRMQV